MNASISNVDSLNKELMLSTVSVTDTLVTMMSSDIVEMRSSNGAIENFTLSESI